MSSTSIDSVQSRLEAITARVTRTVDPASLYGVAVRLLALAAVVEPANSADVLNAAQRDYLADAIAGVSADVFRIVGASHHGS